MQISTDKQCQNVHTDKTQEDMPIDGVPGLALRVTKDGHKSWTLRYRRQSDGKLRRQSLGTYPDVGLKEARERARLARNEVSDGADPAGAKQVRRAATTFEGLAEQWIAFKERQGRAQSYTGRSKLRLANIPANFREMKAQDLARVDVTGVLDIIAKRGATTEVNRFHALISAVYKWAVSEGLIERDPSAGIKKRFHEEARERVWREDELRTFWHGLDTVPATEATKIAMRLVLATGQRPKEIAHMRRDKLVLDGLHPQMTTPRESAKNRIEHVVPLSALAVGLIKRALELSQHGTWVFPNPAGDGPLDPHAFAVVLHRARDTKSQTLFGLKDAQLYDARKTMATYLGDQGHPNQFVGLLLNHLTAKAGSVTGRHYNHSRYMAQKRTMMAQWSAYLERVIGATTANDARTL